MGKIRTRDLIDNCKDCNMDFTQDRSLHICIGLCKKCYQNFNYTKRFGLKSINTGACINCNAAWGDLNKKGKIVKRQANNLCRQCYHKIYKQTGKLCVNCKEPILNKTTKDICSRCFIPVTEKRIKNADGKLVRVKKVKYQISKDEYENLRKLLNRFKFGVNTLVDTFKVIDFFIILVAGEGGLSKYESMDADAQIIYMLKDLKEVYELYKKELTMNVGC
jgi:hypothetical protein